MKINDGGFFSLDEKQVAAPYKRRGY